MADWDAKAYARVSDPQFRWGLRVLERLTLKGDENVVDLGCGTGRVTEVLAERLPKGRITAVDASTAMVRQASALLGRFGARVTVLLDDATTFVEDPPADVVFSTATFHWVSDHDRLFASIRKSLKPGGRLVAQCGGGPNLGRLRRRTAELRRDPTFAASFEGFHEPWTYATDVETRERLERAGFVDVKTSLEPEPTRFDDRASFEEFVTKVILRDELPRLPEALRGRYLKAVVDAAERDTPAFELDYVRLNLDASAPASG